MSQLGRKRFTWLLDQRVVPYRAGDELQEWIPVEETRPDFCARPWGFPPFLAKVRWFSDEEPLRFAEVGGSADRSNPKLISRLVRWAAADLRPYKRLRLAMVVVLDDDRHGGGPPGPRELIHLAESLEDRRAYVSAVLVTLSKGGSDVQPADKECPLRARILHNPAAAVPLHFGIFSEPEDEHIVRAEGRWVDLRTGTPCL